MTLVEVLLASACTASIVGAGSTMMLAVSYSAQSTQAGSAVSVQGHNVVTAIRKEIRGARLIGYHDSSRYTLWLDDSNADDRIQLSETAYIAWDATGSQIKRVRPYRSSMTAGEINPTNYEVTITQFQAVDMPDNIDKSAFADTAVLAENVAAFAVESNASGVSANMLDINLKVVDGNLKKEFVASAAPLAPADYLTDSAKYTDDGDPLKRKRRVIAKDWKVP